ncbi:reticulon-like protein B21 isoform X2 [Trifolium pratense]|uniref:reticulon-like protein B21 isoform X2 n=1 Tax=Trifolium pratense TaxID=57577 RepID=UPI001E6972DB|nr:reticulon-like protein B21 isoform X2 [Trifolium pratense]
MELNIISKSKRTSVVAAGSVWETRMKNDQVKGGIKVFKAQEQKLEQDVVGDSSRFRRTSSKRKTCSPIQFSKGKPDGINNKTPIRNRKIADKFQRKIRSDDDDAEELIKIKSDPINKNPSESVTTTTTTDSIELRKLNSELDRVQLNSDEEDHVINDDEIEIIAMENESFDDDDDDVKEITIPENNNNNNNVVLNQQEENKKVVNESEPKKIVNAQMRFHHKNETRSVSVPIVVKNQSPTIRRNSTIYQNSNFKDSGPKEEEHISFPQTQSKLQSLVDLIMWRDVSRSAFVFGIGTFIIISSSYARDINLSLISAISYLGLVYLAVIFLYRSLICRGVIDIDDSNYVLGEKDAIWMLKLVLPYLNEFLSKLKALFSGDPGTTMKLAVLLFILARCGSFITIWKMAKFGFFGVFIVPKICSSYSAQLTAYGYKHFLEEKYASKNLKEKYRVRIY